MAPLLGLSPGVVPFWKLPWMELFSWFFVWRDHCWFMGKQGKIFADWFCILFLCSKCALVLRVRYWGSLKETFYEAGGWEGPRLLVETCFSSKLWPKATPPWYTITAMKVLSMKFWERERCSSRGSHQCSSHTQVLVALSLASGLSAGPSPFQSAACLSSLHFKEDRHSKSCSNTINISPCFMENCSGFSRRLTMKFRKPLVFFS